jgi:hypothetical protein
VFWNQLQWRHSERCNVSQKRRTALIVRPHHRAAETTEHRHANPPLWLSRCSGHCNAINLEGPVGRGVRGPWDAPCRRRDGEFHRVPDAGVDGGSDDRFNVVITASVVAGVEVPSADIAAIDRHYKLTAAVRVAVGESARVSVCPPVKDGLLGSDVVAHELDRHTQALPEGHTSAADHQPVPARRELDKRLLVGVVALAAKRKAVGLCHTVLVNHPSDDWWRVGQVELVDVPAQITFEFVGGCVCAG